MCGSQYDGAVSNAFFFFSGRGVERRDRRVLVSGELKKIFIQNGQTMYPNEDITIVSGGQ